MSELSNAVRMGVRPRVEDVAAQLADADARIIAAERTAAREQRNSVSLEAEVASLSAKAKAAQAAYVDCEQRLLVAETRANGLQAQLDACKSELQRAEQTILSMNSIASYSQDTIAAIKASADGINRTVVTTVAANAPQPSAAPEFEMSFARDSTGRMKSPVTFKPR